MKLSNLLFLSTVLALSSAGQAQMVTCSMSGAWTVTPCTQQTINNFSTSNGVNGVLQGGASAEAGCNTFNYGAGTIQGFLLAGPAISENRSAVAGCLEIFIHPVGGSASCSATVSRQGSPVYFPRGATVTGRVRTSVAFTCSLFGWLRNRSTVRIPQGTQTWSALTTAPQSATASGSGLTQFNVNTNGGSVVQGSVNNAGDALQLNTTSGIAATVVLN